MQVDGGLRPVFRKHLPMLFFQSVETGGTGQGVPDSHYIAQGGISGWIEYKQTTGHTVDLRPEQISWLLRYSRLGGRAWIAARRRSPGGPRSPACDELHLLPGSLAVEARAGGLRCPALSQPPHWVASGGPSRWPWAEVLRLLLA